jgi:acyl-CoA thioesterase-2
MHPKLAELLGCLDLEPVADGVVRGPNLDIGYHRVFGGQILAQAIAAAAGAVPGKAVKSLTVTFPREGDAARPMHYRVEVHHQGRTYATVGVTGFQPDDSGAERVVAVALVSMHATEDGLHHSVAPPDVGTPEDAAEQSIPIIPWEVRVVGGVDLHDRAAGPPTYEWWTRAPDLDAADGPAGRPGSVDQALLAHATDLTVIGTALRPIEGISEADSQTRIATAVTSHSLWFHQPFAITEWLLVSQEGPVVAAGRAFGRGDVFQGPELVASFAQESMIRQLPPG